jgi:hypothetical protein
MGYQEKSDGQVNKIDEQVNTFKNGRRGQQFAENFAGLTLGRKATKIVDRY